jgi:hypothetical protein
LSGYSLFPGKALRTRKIKKKRRRKSTFDLHIDPDGEKKSGPRGEQKWAWISTKT